MKLPAVINYLVSSPLNDKDTSYYTALSKQPHSYNDLLFFCAKVISYYVRTEINCEHKPPPFEHTSPIRNTLEKFSATLQNRTLRDITQLLDPYKRNPSDSLITTLTHLIHCYDRTHKLL